MVQVWYQDAEWPSIWKVFSSPEGADTFPHTVAWDWIGRCKAGWTCYKVVVPGDASDTLESL